MERLKRITIYFKEMFPLSKYIPYILITFSAIYGITQISCYNKILLDMSFVYGFVTVFCATLLMRNYDELKDKEVDARLFPSRALPRGAVKYSDVWFLVILNFVLIVIVFFLKPKAPISLLVMLIYSILTFKWFFLPNIISKNLLLAFVTHQPFVLFVYVYMVCQSAPVEHCAEFSVQTIPSIVALFLTVSTWEISRKIRVNETEYVTYSKLFGPTRTAFAAMCALIFSIVLDCVAGYIFEFDWWFFVVFGILASFYAFYFIRFFRNPVESNLQLKSIAEAAGIMIPLVYVVQLLIKYEVTWK